MPRVTCFFAAGVPKRSDPNKLESGSFDVDSIYTRALLCACIECVIFWSSCQYRDSVIEGKKSFIDGFVGVIAQLASA